MASSSTLQATLGMAGRAQAAATNRAISQALDQPGAQKTFAQKVATFSVEFGPNRRDILNFTNQLSVMVKAGIGVHEALENIAAQIENKKFKAIINSIANDVTSGQSLSYAVAKYPDVFTNLYVNMISAAEVSGSLSSMLEKLVEYLDQEAETRSQVKGAMVYPVIIATMAITVTIFLLTFVLPRFTAIFVGKERLLPAPTKAIMAASAFTRGYWYFILPALGALAWGFHIFVHTPAGRNWWDMVKLRLPLMKTLCRNLYITRSLHTMGVLMNAGVPILDTLLITSEISGNVHYKNMWRRVHDSVKEGQKIAFSLTGSKLLPAGVVHMIRSGEESGRLCEVLEDVTRFYSRELKTVIKAVTSMIEPIMICVMGVVVGFIAMSVILPIFKMSSLVSGK
jgi:type IV pilus assembly protein PilC